jgi:hypothetical protein
MAQRRIILVSLFSLLMSIAAATASEETPEAKDERVKPIGKWKEAIAAIKNAKVEVFQIKPLDKSMDADKDNETMLYGWPIVARTIVKDAADVASITQILTDPQTYSHVGARCFFPGLAFRYSAGDTNVTFVICLDCKWVYEMDGKTQQTCALSDEGKAALLKQYEKYFAEAKK